MKNEIINYKNNPDLYVFSAITASMSLPILIKPFKINNNLYVDGSVTNDLPFNDIENLNTVLAFKYQNFKDDKDRVFGINNLSNYLISILNSMLLNNVFMEKYQDNIIYIDFDCLDFFMETYEEENVKKAIDISYEQSIVKIKQTCEFLDKRETEKNEKKDINKDINKDICKNE